MEPRAQRRTRRRRRQVKFISLAVFSMGCLVFGRSSAGFGTTLALAVSRQQGTATFGSLSSTEGLAIDTAAVAVNELTAGETFGAIQILEVRNRSQRSIPVEVTVVGAPGLEAEVSPHVLAPGGSAVVTLFGKPEKAGEYQGRLVVSGLGGFLSHTIAIRGLVKEPVVKCPPAPTAIDSSNPDAIGNGSPGSASVDPAPPDLAPAAPAPVPVPADSASADQAVPALGCPVPAAPAPAEPAPAPADPAPAPADPAPAPADPAPAPAPAAPPAKP